jgi:carbamate kinase
VKVVIALGGNALLKRGEEMSADVQRANVRLAAAGLAQVAAEHQLIVSHGRGRP